MKVSGRLIAAFHRPGRFLFLALILTFTFSFSTVSAQPRGSSAQSPARPLDPLTPREKEIAVRVAQDDRRVRDLLGDGKHRLIYVEFFALKPDDRSRTEERPGRPIRIGRHAEVVLFNAASERGAQAIVDLERRSVVEVERLEADAVPLTPDDIEEARVIALRSEEVRSLLGRDAERFQVLRRTRVTRGDEQLYVVGGLRYRSGDPNDPCYRQRCVALSFRRGRVYFNEALILVNLSTRTLRVERRRR